MAKLSMASGDVISSIKAVIGYMHCKKMRRMVFFMNTATAIQIRFIVDFTKNWQYTEKNRSSNKHSRERNDTSNTFTIILGSISFPVQTYIQHIGYCPFWLQWDILYLKYRYKSSAELQLRHLAESRHTLDWCLLSVLVCVLIYVCVLCCFWWIDV